VDINLGISSVKKNVGEMAAGAFLGLTGAALQTSGFLLGELTPMASLFGEDTEEQLSSMTQWLEDGGEDVSQMGLGMIDQGAEKLINVNSPFVIAELFEILAQLADVGIWSATSGQPFVYRDYIGPYPSIEFAYKYHAMEPYFDEEMAIYHGADWQDRGIVRDGPPGPAPLTVDYIDETYDRMSHGRFKSQYQNGMFGSYAAALLWPAVMDERKERLEQGLEIPGPKESEWIRLYGGVHAQNEQAMRDHLDEIERMHLEGAEVLREEANAMDVVEEPEPEPWQVPPEIELEEGEVYSSTSGEVVAVDNSIPPGFWIDFDIAPGEMESYDSTYQQALFDMLVIGAISGTFVNKVLARGGDPILEAAKHATPDVGDLLSDGPFGDFGTEKPSETIVEDTSQTDIELEEEEEEEEKKDRSERISRQAESETQGTMSGADF